MTSRDYSDFQTRTAIVTGSDSGTGKATAVALAIAGMDVGITWHEDEKGAESFNGKLRDEFLDGEIFTTLNEAQVLINDWRDHYDHQRPHSALGYRPPAPELWLISLDPPTLDTLMS